MRYRKLFYQGILAASLMLGACATPPFTSLEAGSKVSTNENYSQSISFL